MNSYLTILCLLMALLHIYVVCAENSGKPKWSYEGNSGPDNWQRNYPDCNGTSQSPIKIPEEDVITKDMGFIRYTWYKKDRPNMTLTNNGHTAQLSMDENEEDEPYIEGADLEGQYYFKQLHCHWGKDDNSGSEHILDPDYGRALEMHLVHVNPDNGNIAVLGILFQLTAKNNPDLNCITDALENIQNEGDTTTVECNVRLSRFVRNRKNFYRYTGSLTTPPCTEGVIWTVFRNISYIGTEQLEAFRKLRHVVKKGRKPTSMAPNFRPTQEINDRPIFTN